MEDGETPLGSWAVFLGENGPGSAKITGRLHVTDRHVYFQSGLKLDAGAWENLRPGALDWHGDLEPPFQVLGDVLRIPRGRIAHAATSRQWWIVPLKSLHLCLDDGAEWVFRFGLFSPRPALAALGGDLRAPELPTAP